MLTERIERLLESAPQNDSVLAQVLLYMCPHTTICVFMLPCVLVLRYMSHATMYVS
jgi:hypothetical protein